MKYFIIKVLSLFIYTCAFSQNNGKAGLLYGNGCKYWDATHGYSLCFCKDYKCVEYTYINGVKEKPNYYDVIVDKMKWKLTNNFIYIHAGKSLIGKYKIIKLTENSLVMVAIYKISIDTLIFKKAKNQTNIVRQEE